MWRTVLICAFGAIYAFVATVSVIFAKVALFAQSAHDALRHAPLLRQGITPPAETLSLHNAHPPEHAEPKPIHPARTFQWNYRSDRTSPTRKGTSAYLRHIIGDFWSASQLTSRSFLICSQDGSGLRSLLPKA